MLAAEVTTYVIILVRPLEQGFLGNGYRDKANQAQNTFESVALMD